MTRAWEEGVSLRSAPRRHPPPPSFLSQLPSPLALGVALGGTGVPELEAGSGREVHCVMLRQL